MLWQLLELLRGQFSEETIPEGHQKATGTCKADHDVIIAEVLKNLSETTSLKFSTAKHHL